MKFTAISLKKIEYEGEVVSINLRTTSGEITVLDNHRPLITQLVSGQAVIIKKDGNRFSLDIKSGFLEMDEKNAVTLLVS